MAFVTGVGEAGREGKMGGQAMALWKQMALSDDKRFFAAIVVNTDFKACPCSFANDKVKIGRHIGF